MELHSSGVHSSRAGSYRDVLEILTQCRGISSKRVVRHWKKVVERQWGVSTGLYTKLSKALSILL